MARELTALLLGHFSLALAGAELTGVYSARLQALLANLLLHRDAPQSRQQLAFLFLLEQRRDSDRASASATRSACCAMTSRTKQPTAISSRACAGVRRGGFAGRGPAAG